MRILFGFDQKSVLSSLSLGPQHVRSTPSPAHEALKMRGSVLFPPSVASLHISEKTSTIEIIE